MRLPVDWDEQYLLSLPVGEHDWVEFKGARALDFSLPKVDENRVLEELSKQLSAFANSGGGTIVYGIDDDASGTRRIDNGGISLKLKGRSTKEWLEDVIPNLVEFPLTSFNVYTIIRESDGSSIEDNKCIVLIDVHDSDSAPHQARDARYYARVAGKSRPIGHRLVLDIVGRAKYPKMNLSANFIRSRQEFYLMLFCENVGKIYANYVNGLIRLPVEMVERDEGRLRKIDGHEYKEIFIENIHKDIIDVKGGMPATTYSPGIPTRYTYITRYDPVLPGLGFSQRIGLRITREELRAFAQDELQWELYADNAPVIEGSVKITEIPVEIRV